MLTDNGEHPIYGNEILSFYLRVWWFKSTFRSCSKMGCKLAIIRGCAPLLGGRVLVNKLWGSTDIFLENERKKLSSFTHLSKIRQLCGLSKNVFSYFLFNPKVYCSKMRKVRGNVTGVECALQNSTMTPRVQLAVFILRNFENTRAKVGLCDHEEFDQKRRRH